MRRRPAVSVVIPTHNRARFLDEALRSVFRQTRRDFEVIVVDDASTDGTRRVLRRWGGSIRAVTLKKNRGPAHARNIGVGLSRGRLIAFLDSDDLWYPHKLERQIPLFRDPEVRLAVSDIDVIGQGGRVIRRRHLKRSRRLYWRGYRCHKKHIHVVPSTAILRKSVFRKIGLFDPRFRYYRDDDDFFARLEHAEGRRAVRMEPEALIAKRRHGLGNITSDYAGSLRPGRWTRRRKEFLLDMVHWLTKYGKNRHG